MNLGLKIFLIKTPNPPEFLSSFPLEDPPENYSKTSLEKLPWVSSKILP